MQHIHPHERALWMRRRSNSAVFRQRRCGSHCRDTAESRATRNLPVNSSGLNAHEVFLPSSTVQTFFVKIAIFSTQENARNDFTNLLSVCEGVRCLKWALHALALPRRWATRSEFANKLLRRC